MTTIRPLLAALAFAVPITVSPATAAPAIPPESVIDAALVVAECVFDHAEIEAEIAPLGGLDDGLILVDIPCWMAAYQAGSILIAFDPDAFDPDASERARLLRFPVPSADGFTDTPSLTFPDYDPETKRITSLHRGRGLGDCGSAGRWQWSAGSFVLESYWEKPDCDGELFDPFGEPQAWRVYP